MGSYKDVLPQSQGWIHDLAKSEVHPDAEALLRLNGSFDPQQLVEESTIDFLSELKGLVTDYARMFNAYSEAGAKYQDIKVFGIAQAAADFMLFRNQIKLVFSNASHGIISIAFAHHVRGAVAIDGQIQATGTGTSHSAGLGPSQELLAQVGPFRDVYWVFQTEKVTPEQVAKFYFTEFTRVTRDVRKTRGSNQALLEQIRTLLEQKGLDL